MAPGADTSRGRFCSPLDFTSLLRDPRDLCGFFAGDG